MGRWVEDSIRTLCTPLKRKYSPSRPSLHFPELVVARVQLSSKWTLVYLRMKEAAAEVGLRWS